MAIKLSSHLERQCISTNCNEEICEVSTINGMFSCVNHDCQLLAPIKFIGRLQCWICINLFFVDELIFIDNPDFTICRDCIANLIKDSIYA